MSRIQRLLAAVDVERKYELDSEEVHALRGVNLNVFPGQFIAVVGRSGSGKTSLLNIMAGLDKPSDGKVLFEEQDLAEMSEQELTDLRRHRIGFIFQSFGLLPLLSAFENVELPLRISGVTASERAERTREALDIVGSVDPLPTPALRAIRRRAAASRHCPRHRDTSVADTGGRAYGGTRLQQRSRHIRAVQGHGHKARNQRGVGDPRLNTAVDGGRSERDTRRSAAGAGGDRAAV